MSVNCCHTIHFFMVMFLSQFHIAVQFLLVRYDPMKRVTYCSIAHIWLAIKLTVTVLVAEQKHSSAVPHPVPSLTVQACLPSSTPARHQHRGRCVGASGEIIVSQRTSVQRHGSGHWPTHEHLLHSVRPKCPACCRC